MLVTVVADGGGNTAIGAHEGFAQPVQFARGDAGLDERRDVVERIGCNASGNAHLFKVLRIVQADRFAVVFLGGMAHGFSVVMGVCRKHGLVRGAQDGVDLFGDGLVIEQVGLDHGNGRGKQHETQHRLVAAIGVPVATGLPGIA